MEREWWLVSDEKSTISGVRHPDWIDMGEPCPECGAQEFRHFSTSGGRYGLIDDSVALRSDYWSATKSLFTQCLECDAVLYKHPAFDLLFTTPENKDGVSLDF